MRSALLKLSATPEMKARFKAAAEARGMALSTWLLQAALKYAQTNESFDTRHKAAKTWPSGWPKAAGCFHCGEIHDPLEAHPVFIKADIRRELKLLGAGDDLAN